MTHRRSLFGWLLVTALVVGGCSGTAPSGAPSIDVPETVPASGLEGFCAEFAAELGEDWPDVDASTAAALGTVIEEWSTNPDLATISNDVRTLGSWLASMAQSGAAASPPGDVNTAFDNIRSFADSNC